MAGGLPWVGSSGKAPNPRDMYPRPASSFDVDPQEVANRDDDIPLSKAPGRLGQNNQVSSRTGNTMGPHTGTSNFVHESLDKNWPAGYLRANYGKPRLMR